MQRIAQFEHQIDFTPNAILRPAQTHAGHAGGVLVQIYSEGRFSGDGALLSHLLPDLPYTRFALFGKGDRVNFHDFVWRGRKYWIAVHSDRTAMIFSTTKSGFDMRVVPIVFEIPEDLSIIGDPRSNRPILRLKTDFNNALLARVHPSVGSDWMRPAIPLLNNDRKGLRTEDFTLRGCFRAQLNAEIKHLWKCVEKSRPEDLPKLPWWGRTLPPGDDASIAWLHGLLESAGEYVRVKTGCKTSLKIFLTGRTLTPQGFVTRPSIDVTSPVGTLQADIGEMLSWVIDALDSKTCPISIERQIVHAEGKPQRLADLTLTGQREDFTAHEVIEVLSRAQQYAA